MLSVVCCMVAHAAGTGRFGEPRGYTVVKIPPFQYNPTRRCASGGNDVPADTPVPGIVCTEGDRFDTDASIGSSSAAQLTAGTPVGRGAKLDTGFRDDVLAKMDEMGSLDSAASA